MEGLYDAVAPHLGPAERLHLRGVDRARRDAVDHRRRPRVAAARAFVLCRMLGWSLAWAVYWDEVRRRAGPVRFDATWRRRALWWAVDFPSMTRPTIPAAVHAGMIRGDLTFRA